jgi:hypothetical protein
MKRAALALILAVTPASADVQQPAGGGEVDWTRGLLIARSIGTADRRAPAPTIARVGARREAEGRAAAALVAAARTLPAPAGTVGDAADADAAVAGALDAAARAALDLATELMPDGSTRIQRGLPVEAIRQALTGPRAIVPAWAGAASAGDAPTALVVDARNLDVAPRVGITVTDGAVTVAMPAIWVDAQPGDRDARLGGRPRSVQAERLDAGALVVAPGAPLEAAARSGALLVVVVREGS